MKPNRKTLLLPLLLITLGTGWLLSTLGVVPDINWVWTLGLAVIGVATFVVCGFDKVTAVTGPFFMLTSCLSILRQTDQLPLDVEVPLLVIVSGALLMLARSRAIPVPDWITEEPSAS